MIQEEGRPKGRPRRWPGTCTAYHGDGKNFAGLPDEFWGYYARGHDSKGAFCMVVMYSGDEKDVDSTIHAYEEWLAGRRSAGLHE